MITQVLTAEANSAAERYGLLVEGWRSAYANALDTPDFGTPKSLARLTKQAYTLANTYLDSEGELILASAERVASEAQRETLVELEQNIAQVSHDATSEHVSASIDYIERELRVQIERDIAFLQQSLRKTVLSVGLASRAQRIPLRAALLQYRIGNASELHFFFHDRRAQKWPSRKFIRAVWRSNMLAIYNETVLMILAEHGIESAFIKHSDPNSDSHGMELSFSPNTEMPTYAELRDTLFHPNAEAILARAV